MDNMKVYYGLYNINFGDFFIASTDLGLCNISFIEGDYSNQLNWLRKYFSEDNIIHDNENNYNLEATDQLNKYFEGKIKKFNINMHLLGTDFQKQVWNILTSIKLGDIWTYKDVAFKIGDVKKCRAVGGAIGKNPIAIMIPCHRVIGSNGKLTGFSAPGGIETKKKLLNIEGHRF